VEALGEGIYSYNATASGIDDGEEFGIFLRDEGADLYGWICGWTWAGCMEIRYLWVRQDRRGQGHGSKLLTAAEDAARERGCQMAFLDTYSFQAPDFYRSRGYDVYAVADDFPIGHQKLFLRKRLTPGEAATP
jgi:GNAT superfamily N-acetyltransferase